MSFVTDFVALLNNTTTSYKYLFLKSILTRVVDGETTLCLDDLVLDILVQAWYPNQFFKLSFGNQDGLSSFFENQGFQFSDSKYSITSPCFKKRLRLALASQVDLQSLRRELSRYVQFRLLTPFFSGELRGKPDGIKNRMIRESAAARYDSRKPLYKILDTPNKIVVHPGWTEFIKTNAPLLMQYLESKLIEYLQKRNPNVPSIIHKTEPPSERRSLNKQRAYWQDFIIGSPKAACIYEGTLLHSDSISIDHFLPWSFVCHDKIWNLAPTTHSINSKKGNSLPHLDQYLDPFINLQHRAIRFHSKYNRNWNHIASDISNDLKLSPNEIAAEENAFSDCLSNLITNQYEVARQLGFDSWKL